MLRAFPSQPWSIPFGIFAIVNSLSAAHPRFLLVSLDSQDHGGGVQGRVCPALEQLGPANLEAAPRPARGEARAHGPRDLRRHLTFLLLAFSLLQTPRCSKCVSPRRPKAEGDMLLLPVPVLDIDFLFLDAHAHRPSSRRHGGVKCGAQFFCILLFSLLHRPSLDSSQGAMFSTSRAFSLLFSRSGHPRPQTCIRSL